MRANILAKIIKDTYEKEFRHTGKNQAMKITFILNDDKIIELLIIWEGYVGVFENVSGKWNCLSCHDSCWRSDGIDSFIHKYDNNIRFIDGLFNWFEQIEITDEINKEFREIERNRFK